MTEVLRPRGSNCLVRIIQHGTTAAGIAVSEYSIQGKDFRVEAIGPNVPDDLMVGDSVLMKGALGIEYYPLPNHRDLIMIDEQNVTLIIEEHEDDH